MIFRNWVMLGQTLGHRSILEKPCVHSRGHRFDHKIMNLCQNVNHHNV